MKKSILGTVFVLACALSTSASAAALCSGGAATSVDLPTGSFVKVPRAKVKCSANVFLDGVDSSNTVYAVGAASAKGKKYFTGNTAGGAVRAVGDCAGATCAASDAAAGSQQGITDASSS